MTGATLRIGVVQFELRAERSVEGFLEHVDSLVTEAVDQSVELVVLPELASTGLLGAIGDRAPTVGTVAADYRDFLAPLWGDILAGVRAIAVRRGTAILGGSHNRIAEDGTLRNTAVLVHPDGSVETQDKIHLTPPEHDLGMVGGDDLLVTTVGPMTVGVLICADIEFPELSRYLGAMGVDLILNPSLTWNRRGVFRVHNGANARASENQAFVAMSPLIGSSGLPEDGPLHAVGTALVACPVDKTFGHNDGLLAICEAKEEGVLVVELDRDLLLASRDRPEVPGVKLRRPDVYARLQARQEGR